MTFESQSKHVLFDTSISKSLFILLTLSNWTTSIVNTRCCKKCIVRFSRIQINDRSERYGFSSVKKSSATHQNPVTCMGLLLHCGMVLALFLTCLCPIVEQVKVSCLSSSHSQLFASRWSHSYQRVTVCWVYVKTTSKIGSLLFQYFCVLYRSALDNLWCDTEAFEEGVISRQVGEDCGL